MISHEQVIQQFLNAGWFNGRWKESLRDCIKRPPWSAEADDIREALRAARFTPDAWRVVIEDENTPNADWSHPVFVLELLEVEVAHPMDEEKEEMIRAFWWELDGTELFHCRVYRVDRYGTLIAHLTEQTAHAMPFDLPLRRAR